MTSWKSCTAVERHSEKVSGCWVFSSLFENLKDGASIHEFLEWFPSVERWQIESVLDHETKALRETGYS